MRAKLSDESPPNCDAVKGIFLAQKAAESSHENKFSHAMGYRNFVPKFVRHAMIILVAPDLSYSL